MPDNTETTTVSRPFSDGSELIPAEVGANLDSDGNISLDKPLGDGYTVDEEGLFNNYAIEPDLQPATYPAPYQQRRYILQGAIAIVFLAFIVWVAFAVS
jgi:hypothetical protein